MFEHPYPGKLILFEGQNGAGKSTQVAMAHQWVRTFCPDAILTKEPYTRTHDNRRVLLGHEIHDILKGNHNRTRLAQMPVEDFQRYFYFPNRANHYLEVVIPALEKGLSVLSDRGLASVCFGAESNAALYRLMAEQLWMFEVMGLPWPDAIIIYDVPPEIAMQRLQGSGKALDGHENLKTQERVRERYHFFARNWPNCHLVSADEDAQKVFDAHTKRIVDLVINTEKYQVAADHGVIM